MNTNTFYKTFSGTDTIAFLIFKETKPILLGSLSTLSHSVYREKKPVPLVGKINTGGYTRGMRSIAGTMVFTLINQHLVEDICEQIPYIGNHGKVKADELPFFDIMVICANEYGAASQMYIYGAEFFEDGQVISVQDLYIENTFSFVARDIDDFSRINPIVSSGSINSAYTTETLIGYAFSKQEYESLYDNVTNNNEKTKNIDKIIEVQSALKDNGYDIKITGVENDETVNAIKKYQSSNGLTATGTINEATYDLLINNNDKKSVYKITNKNGAYVYSNTDKDNIIGIAKNQDDFVGEDNGEYVKIKYGGTTGYINKNDTNRVETTIKTTYDEKIDSGKTYTYKLSEFDPTEIGAEITTNKESEYKISAVSYYKNGEISTSQRYYVLQDGETKDLNLSYLSDSFTYNKNNGMPYMVEYVMTTVLTGEIRKWIIKFK